MFLNHGYKARTEFVTRSYEVLDSFVLHWKKNKKKRKIKTKRIHRSTRFRDNFDNCFLATAPKILVGIS